jgi:hypothetical protein
MSPSEVQACAKGIGGHLEVWSEHGAGTEVELTIPASVAYGSRASRRFRLFRSKLGTNLWAASLGPQFPDAPVTFPRISSSRPESCKNSTAPVLFPTDFHSQRGQRRVDSVV